MKCVPRRSFALIGRRLSGPPDEVDDLVSQTRERRSCNDRLDDLPVHVGQPVVAAAVAVGQPLVVDAQQVQDGGVQVVDVDLVLRRRTSRTRRWRRGPCRP